MDNNQGNPTGGQLPNVQSQNSGPGVTPASTASPSNAAMTVADQALRIFTDTALTPHQMAQQFIQLKGQYLQEHGIELGG